MRHHLDHLHAHRIPAQQQPAAGTCILLHGLGDSHRGMAGLAMEVDAPEFDWILPDAPDPYFGIGYSWYPIPEAFFQSGGHAARETLLEACREEVRDSRRLVHALLESVLSSAPERPCILGGFSQGGLIAFDAGLTCPRPLAGLFALSSYCPQAAELLPDSPQAADLPLFIGHGDADAVVQYRYAGETRAALGARAEALEFRTYPGMGHAVEPLELDHLRDFLRRCLARAARAG